VNDPVLVRGLERIGDLPRDRQGLVERNRAPGDALRQILALDQFHHQGPYVVSGFSRTFLDAVDRRDVRMVERSEHFGFALKTREPIHVGGH
jgi:hypothetical protein